jgi:hypothetical protein
MVYAERMHIDPERYDALDSDITDQAFAKWRAEREAAEVDDERRERKRRFDEMKRQMGQ